MTLLSIRAAAREEPDRIGLIAGEHSYTFAELATLSDDAGRDERIIARADVATALALYARLERGSPSILVHPRLTATERAALPPGTGALVTVFTSGSSGTPKAVGLTAEMLIASARASEANLGWVDGDRWLCAMPLAHVGGLSIITRCLAARRCAVLDDGPFEPTRVAALIEGEGVTLLSLVPTMLARLVDTGWAPPSHLRAALIGGASAPTGLLERAASAGIPILTTYGMTETCSQICTQPVAEAGTPSQDAGPALRGVDLRVVDGEIWVGGPMVAADDWYRTGDRGWLDERGRLHVAGRSDDTIISGGENVDPSEVEDALSRHPDIADACAFGVRDEHWGEIVAAAVVPRDADVDLTTVARSIAADLAGHKRPRLMCAMSALPVGTTGKVDRRAVRRHASDRLVAVGVLPSRRG
jgi:O-succinylbenzoic acid--CoA ligase